MQVWARGELLWELSSEKDVVGIDVSPGAVEVARGRGVRDVRLLAFEEVDESLGHFDTIVMFGNNFGLFGSRSRAQRLLRRLRPLADRIVAASNNPYATRETQPISRIRNATASAAECRDTYDCVIATATSSVLGSTT